MFFLFFYIFVFFASVTKPSPYLLVKNKPQPYQYNTVSYTLSNK